MITHTQTPKLNIDSDQCDAQLIADYQLLL